jgi:hypothetical protein
MTQVIEHLGWPDGPNHHGVDGSVRAEQLVTGTPAELAIPVLVERAPNIGSIQAGAPALASVFRIPFPTTSTLENP